MSLYTHFLRPLLFRFDAESAHEAALAAASAAGASAPGRAVLRSIYGFEDERLATEVAGLRFPNPLGLAAGFDKNGRAVQALCCLGLGHLEIGSVSARPSRGNPRPRLFRLPADEAIVVNYGVPNDGADTVARRVSAQPMSVPLGVNLVETNTGHPAPPDGVIAEFVEAARAFTGPADYLTLNLNCPNTTAGASPFDDPAAVAALLAGLAAVDGLPPVFLKLTARTDPPFIETLLEAVDPFPLVAGFVFNLPPGKEYSLRTPAAEVDPLPGTLCGPPARGLLDDTVRAWYGRIDRRRHRIIGSGGIASAEDAWRKIRLGASLLQLYTGLVYHGPGLVRRINRGLVRLLEAEGLSHVREAVGLDNAADGGGRDALSGQPPSARPLAPARG